MINRKGAMTLISPFYALHAPQPVLHSFYQEPTPTTRNHLLHSEPDNLTPLKVKVWFKVWGLKFRVEGSGL